MKRTENTVESALRIEVTGKASPAKKFGRDEVIACLSAIACADISDYIEISDGGASVKDISALPPEKRLAVASVKNAAGGRGAELHLYDRMKALEMLCKCLGLYSPDTDDTDVLARLDEVLEQAAGA